MVLRFVEEEMGGTTYAVQYFTDSRAKLEDYYKNHAKITPRRFATFGDKMLAFRTELEVMEEFGTEKQLKWKK